jgi:hypothetical protein
METNVSLTTAEIIRERNSFWPPLIAEGSYRPMARGKPCKPPEIEQLAALGDVRQQHVHKWVLAIERSAALVFERNDSFDNREVKHSERIVFFAKG